MEFFSSIERKNPRTDIGLILLMSVMVLLPIALFGIPRGNDLPQHYQFAVTYRDRLGKLDPLPGWSANSNSGFGDPGVRFYPPLGYYLLAIADLAARDWFAASLLSFALLFFIGAVGVYFWAREYFEESAALFAAVVYVCAPYHVNQLYNAFTYAEFAGAAVLPYCFLFASRACRNKGRSPFIGLAVSYAALILTHLPLAVLGSAGLLVYSLASLPRNGRAGVLIRLGLGAALGLAASSFYWVRMATELPFVNHTSPEFSSGSYDFHLNFVASSLFYAPDNGRALWFVDLMLLASLAMFVPGLVLFLLRAGKPDLRKILGVSVLFCFALFVATPLSLPLWEHIRVLQMTQFPWRAMSLVSLCTAFFAAAGYRPMVEAARSTSRPAAILAGGLVVAGVSFAALQIIRPAIYIDKSDFVEFVDNISGARSCVCWWSPWSRAEALDDKGKVLAAGRSVSVDDWQPEHRRFHIADGDAESVRVGTFYYPHWKATVDGFPVEVSKDESGAILVPVSSGAAEVELEFREPTYLRAANLFSLSVWCAFAAFGLLPIFRGRASEFT